MKIISLKQYGHFLSGRSLPKKIVADLNGEAEVTLDFSGVSACNQSFLNELFQGIESAGFKLATIQMVGMETATVKSQVETERARFIHITTMPIGATP
jgi:phosphoribosylaminoimidazole (AIR) synthetase